MRFKILVVTVFLAIGAYAGFWFYLASRVEDKALETIAALKEQGVDIFYDDLSVSGFPYKIILKTAALKVEYAGPQTGGQRILLSLPEVAMVAQPWKLTHGILVADHADLTLADGEETRFRLALDQVKSSLVLDGERRRPERVSLTLDRISWGYGPARPQEALSQAREVQIHLRRPPAGAAGAETLDMPVIGELAVRTRDVMAYELPVGIFGKKADSMTLNLALHGPGLPDISPAGLAAWRDAGGTLTLRTLQVDSGKLDVTLAGDVSLDQDLKPLGAFTAEVAGMEYILEVLSGLSAFRQEPGDEILDDLKAMVESRQNGQDEIVKVLPLSLSLQNGMLFVGPLPMYELPPVIR